MTDIIKEIGHWRCSKIVYEDEHDATAADVSLAICRLLSEIVLKDDAECDKLADWEEKIRELRCAMLDDDRIPI